MATTATPKPKAAAATITASIIDAIPERPPW